jgi:hypothetical protein
VRNKTSKPSIGHVIMFAGATVGWLLLFLLTLSTAGQGSAFWVKVVFSGGFFVASSVGTVLLWRRVQNEKKAATDKG